MHIILVEIYIVRVCYRRQENHKDKKTQKFTVSRPGKTIWSSKIFQNPARFSKYGVSSPEWLVGLLFWI